MRTRNLTNAPPPSNRESGQAMVEFALILFPLLLHRRGNHPVRHRAELLARHAAHREPGRALGGRELHAVCDDATVVQPVQPEPQPTLAQQALIATGCKKSVCVAISFPSGAHSRVIQ